MMAITYNLLMLTLVASSSLQISSHFDQGLRTGEFCQWQTFTANCSISEVLLMESAYYGRMRLGGCIKKDNSVFNCSADVLQVVDWSCSGKQSCQIAVVQFSLLGFHPCTEEMTSYLDVAYRCIHAEQIHAFGMCKTPSLLFIQASQTGYLTLWPPGSAGHYFPHESDPRLGGFTSDSKSCGWTLTASKGHRIVLSMFRFRDPKASLNKTGQSRDNLSLYAKSEFLKLAPCRHVAIVRDKTSGRETRACAEGDLRMENIFLSDGSSVDVLVAMATSGSHVRHLIKYQVTSCSIPSFSGSHVAVVSLTSVHVMCNSTGEKWMLTCLENSWTGVVGSCPHVDVTADDQSTSSMWSTITSEWKSPKGLTLVICLGVLLGVAVGMMMLSFAICLIKQKPRCISEGDRPTDMELYEEATGTRFCPMRFASPAAGDQQLSDSTNLREPTYWDHCLGVDKCSFGQALSKDSFTATWQHHKPEPSHPSFQSASVMSSGIVSGKSHRNPLLNNSISDVDRTQNSYRDDLKDDDMCPDVVRQPSIHPAFQTVLYSDNPVSCWAAKVYEKSPLCTREDDHHLPPPPLLCSCSN